MLVSKELLPKNKQIKKRNKQKQKIKQQWSMPHTCVSETDKEEQDCS